KGWPAQQPPKLDERVEQDLERLLAKLTPERRGLLIRLATTWGSKHFEKYAAEVARALLARIKDEALRAEERVAAARELVGNRATDKETVETLLGQITPATPPELATGLLQALQLSEAREAGQLILDRLPGLTPSARAVGLGVLLGRPEWTRALLESADK